MVRLVPFLLFSLVCAAPAQEAPQTRGLALHSGEWTGDFDAMLEKRRIRVLVPHSRTLYFNDKGRERGLTGETMRDFERYLNRKYYKKLGKRPITVFIVPHTREALLEDVARGLGDIAAGQLTVTEERLKAVDFVTSEAVPTVTEVLVCGPSAPAVNAIDELSGTTVHVRRASSYYESLQSLNQRFRKEGKAPVALVTVPEALEDEDLLEMLNAGIFEFLVVDDWMAQAWAQVLPRIKVRKDIVFRGVGRIGWAVRKGSPQLSAEIMGFTKDFLKKQGVLKSRLAQYHRHVGKIKDPTGSAQWQRFKQTISLFEKYGQKYRFDPLMFAAQGYQESELDQNARSSHGAIGIMQVMPETGASLKVGDITETEPNIHAGAKYMDQLMRSHLPDPGFSEQERTLFAIASYNCGPGNVSKMRKLAAKRGLNPDKWFDSVEVVTAEKIGIETTAYVRNIYKYYVAYKLMLQNIEAKREARKQVP